MTYSIFSFVRIFVRSLFNPLHSVLHIQLSFMFWFRQAGRKYYTTHFYKKARCSGIFVWSTIRCSHEIAGRKEGDKMAVWLSGESFESMLFWICQVLDTLRRKEPDRVLFEGKREHSWNYYFLPRNPFNREVKYI